MVGIWIKSLGTMAEKLVTDNEDPFQGVRQLPLGVMLVHYF